MKSRGLGDVVAGDPRYTTTERNALTVDAAARAKNKIVPGDRIYNTTTNKYNFWNGTAWEVITSA